MTLLWVAIATPPERRGLAMGVRMSGNRLGQLVVPVAVGVTAGQFGVSAIFATVAGMLLGAAGYVFAERSTLADAPGASAERPVVAAAPLPVIGTPADPDP